MRRRSAVLGVVGALFVGSFGCGRGRNEPLPANRTAASGAVAVPASSASSASSAVPPPSANAARPAPGASAGAPVELTEPEKQAEMRYRAALERGRHATLAKNYDAADAAFSEALTARPADTRALGERGFARLQAGRLDAAADDFQTADGRTRDPALAGQIFFNQGLLAERQGDIASAKVAYARSQQAHPTTAAKKKLNDLGGTTCTAAFVPLSQPVKHYASWVALWQAMDEMDDLKTDDAVKKALQVEDCTDVCAVGTFEWYVVMPSASGLDVLQAVDRGGAYRCGTYPQFKFERRGSILWVTSTNEEFEVSLCDPHCNNDDGLCPTCCADGPSHRYDTFIDLNARRAVLRVSQYGPQGDQFNALPVTLDAQNAVHVAGNGCDRSLSLSAK